MRKDEFYCPMALKTPEKYSFQASSKECDALSKRFGFPVFSFDIQGELTGTDPYRVKGTATAKVELTSVLSLEKFETTLSADVEGVFSKHPPQEQDDDSDDYIEQVEQSEIDVGELSVQCFALTIPDYPKKEGEEFQNVIEFEKESPFAALKKLQK